MTTNPETSLIVHLITNNETVAEITKKFEYDMGIVRHVDFIGTDTKIPDGSTEYFGHAKSAIVYVSLYRNEVGMEILDCINKPRSLGYTYAFDDGYFWRIHKNPYPVKDTTMNIHQIAEKCRLLQNKAISQSDEIKNLTDFLYDENLWNEDGHKCNLEYIKKLASDIDTQSKIINILLKQIDINAESGPVYRLLELAEKQNTDHDKLVNKVDEQSRQLDLLIKFNKESEEAYRAYISMPDLVSVEEEEEAYSVHSSMPDLVSDDEEEFEGFDRDY